MSMPTVKQDVSVERERENAAEVGGPEPATFNPLTLQFRDGQVEAAFRVDYFRRNLANLRFGFLGGVVLWVLFGLILHGYLLARADRSFDLAMRYGVFIPLLLLGLGLSFARAFERMWEWVVGVLAVATVLAWVYYITQVLTMPAEYGYVGLILITAFTYTLLRLRFLLGADHHGGWDRNLRPLRCLRRLHLRRQRRSWRPSSS